MGKTIQRVLESTPDPPARCRMTELGPLPEEWRLVRLRDIVERTGQIDPRRRPTQRFKYVDVSSVSRDRFRITSYRVYMGAEAPSRARKLIHVGDVIFATVRPYLKRVAVVPPGLDKQMCSTAFCVLRADEHKVDRNFLFLAAIDDRFVRRVAEHQRGSSYPAVTDKDVLDEIIALPPLPEQRAIAHVLRTVQEAKEATEQVIAAARELKKSLMRHLFTYGLVPVDAADHVPMQETEIGLLPAYWRVVRLGEEVRRGSGSIQTGPFGSQLHASDYVPSGVPVIMPRDLSQNGRINPTNITFVREEDKQRLQRHVLQKGDLVVARRGELGRRGLVTEDEDGWLCGTGCFRIRPGKYVDSMFLSALFGSNIVREQLAANAVGTTMANLNTQIIKNLLIPLPPLAEQREIARILRTVDKKICTEEGRKEALEALFKTLLHDLMIAKRRLPGDFIARFEEERT